MTNHRSVDSIVLPAGVHPSEAKAGVATAPCGALLRPQTENDQTFRATIAVRPSGVVAGIAAFTDQRHYYSLTVEDGPEGSLLLVANRVVDDLTARAEVTLPEALPVEVVIDAHETAYSFRAVANGQQLDLGSGSARLLSAEVAQWFVGVHWSLLAVGPAGASVRFTGVGVADTESTGHASPVPFL